MATKLRVQRASTLTTIVPDRAAKIVVTTAAGVRATTFGDLEDVAVAAAEVAAVAPAEEAGATAGLAAVAPVLVEAESARDQAQAAADTTTATVANAAVQRETLAELVTAMSAASEGALGIVYGLNADEGVYRSDGAGGLDYAGRTQRQIDGRVDEVETRMVLAFTDRPDPPSRIDPSGNFDDSAAALADQVAATEGQVVLAFTDRPDPPARIDTAGNFDDTTAAFGALAAQIDGADAQISVIESTLEATEGQVVLAFTDRPDPPSRIDAGGNFDDSAAEFGNQLVPVFTDRPDPPARIDADGYFDDSAARIPALDLATAATDYCPDVRGSFGDRTIWLAGSDLPPFQLSTGDHAGDNFGAVVEGNTAVRWCNVPPVGPHVITRRVLLTTALSLLAVETIVLLVAIGQSTANGISAGSVITTTPPTPGRVLMWDNGGPRILGTPHSPGESAARVPAGNLLTLVDARENLAAGSSSGETQWTAAGRELQSRLGDDHAVVVATVAIGSQGEANLRVGSPIGQNLMDVVRQTWIAARMRNKAFKVVVAYPQSEAEVTLTQAQFLAQLRGVTTPGVGFQFPYSEAIQAATNSDDDVLFCIDGYANPTKYGFATSQQPLAQLQAALDYPTQFVYGTPGFVAPTVGDGVHRTAAGNLLLGALDGRAIARKLLGQNSLPLHTTGAVVAGSTATCTVHLPFGGGSLTGVSPYVTDPGNLGMTLTRQDNGVAVPVASAAVLSGTQYEVVASSPPAGVPLWLEIGYRGTAGANAGPTTGIRTPLNDGNVETTHNGQVMANHHAIQRLSVTF